MTKILGPADRVVQDFCLNIFAYCYLRTFGFENMAPQFRSERGRK